ncbi:MAG TPA: rhodanese-like domain-containing protein [Chthoniobacterales bacterium]|nr:rhodanese-like domain-containing protein [Chthoniobacterales bacterium]
MKALLRQSALLLALALLPAAVQAFYFRHRIPWQSRVAESELVSVDIARGWGASAIWVDARATDEFERDHVAGAVSLNEDRWGEALSQFLAKDWTPEKKIVVYCSAESCNLAEDVARRLRDEAKLPNEIRILKGGWEAWRAQKK